MLTKFFKHAVAFEVVFAAGTVQAVIALLVALGHHFSAAQAGGIEAGAAAVLALITAGAVDKATPALYSGLGLAIGTCLVAFGVPHISAGEVSAANALFGLLLASLLREKVTSLAKVAEQAKTAKTAKTAV